ncbi:MAG: Asp-tRNA(Asn)/Glu-tRNA(Gln) amidotransferase subunit GatC [Candidatus Micrarchaeia archaeon]
MEDYEFDRLVKICRLKLSSTESAEIKKDINEILEYFKILEDIDTKEVTEAFHPVEIPEKYNEDVPLDFDNIEGILKNTKTYRFYVVGPEI